MSKYNIIALWAFLSFSIFSCSSADNADQFEYSDALIVVSGAKNLQYKKIQGTDQLSYMVNTPYPAKDELSELSDTLESKGWKPLKDDYLNPGLPSSHVRGWTNFIDGTENPNRKVHQWLAQWESMDKEILWCALRYSYPMGAESNLNNLEVYLSFIPANLAVETGAISK